MTEMTHPIQQFSFDGREIRVIMIDGEPWWVAADIAKALGYRDGPAGVRMLRPNQKGSHSVCTSAGDRQATIVSESGLYRMMMRSGRTEAERFQDWVTDEVLPAIRKTGSYSVKPAAPALPMTYAAALRSLADEVDARERAEQALAIAAPKAEQADHHRAADGLLAIGDFANRVKDWALTQHKVRILHAQVWDFLGELGLLIRGDTARHNHPTAFALERGLLAEKVGERESKSSPSGFKATSTPRLTPKGEGWVWDRATKRIAETGSLRKPDSSTPPSAALTTCAGVVGDEP